MSSRLPPMDPRLADELSSRLLTIARNALGRDLQAMIVKGSAIKGDFIPDFSDFDVHLFVNDDAMRSPLTPGRDIAIAFQKQFSEIDIPRYRVSQIQVMFVSASNHPPEWIPALPGTYQLVHGTLPDSLPDVTPELLRKHALEGLIRCGNWIDTLLARMPDKPDDKLADTVRLTGTILKAAAYEAAVVLGFDPFKIWLAPLSEVLDAVEPSLMPSRPATRYYTYAWRWAEIQRSGSDLRAMFRNGIDALEALSAFACRQESSSLGC